MRPMTTVPELTAREHAPYALIVEIRDPNGMPYNLIYRHFNLRGIEETLYQAREGKLASNGWTLNRIFLSYNLVELPVPLVGIPGKA